MNIPPFKPPPPFFLLIPNCICKIIFFILNLCFGRMYSVSVQINKINLKILKNGKQKCYPIKKIALFYLKKIHLVMSTILSLCLFVCLFAFIRSNIGIRKQVSTKLIPLIGKDIAMLLHKMNRTNIG